MTEVFIDADHEHIPISLMPLHMSKHAQEWGAWDQVEGIMPYLLGNATQGKASAGSPTTAAREARTEQQPWTTPHHLSPMLLLADTWAPCTRCAHHQEGWHVGGGGEVSWWGECPDGLPSSYNLQVHPTVLGASWPLQHQTLYKLMSISPCCA